MSRAREVVFKCGPFIGGVQAYPYQVAFGVSVVYWPCLFMPSIRLHVGPFKLWIGVSLRAGRTDQPKEGGE